MQVKDTIIPGVYEIIPDRYYDNRGYFSKIFNSDTFCSIGLETNFLEEYYSYSKKGVIRGMHFQEPPMDLVKLVFCLDGIVLDVILDMRVDSPTFKKHFVVELNSKVGNAVYIPKGVAHGFQVISESALLLYKVSKVYCPTLDSGVLWSSAGIQWADIDPVVSLRDQSLEKLENYISPFRMDSRE